MNTARICRGMSVACAACLFLVHPLIAQTTEEDEFTSQPARIGYGGQILLSNSGFGIGGYYMRILNDDYSVIAELTISSGKDEREVAFFDRFGQKDVPNKANYLLIAPFRVGFEKRLFRDQIEENFRPFIHITGGPTFGWKSPYFQDENKNGVLDQGEKTFDSLSAFPKGSLKLGMGGTVAIGAHFGATRGSSRSVRIGYSFTRFLDEIQLLERSIRPPTRFFGSPIILVSFGRLR